MFHGKQYEKQLRFFLKHEWSARDRVLSQNQSVLQDHVASIKQKTENVVHSDTRITNRILALSMEQGITIAANLMAANVVFSIIVLTFTGEGEGDGGGKGEPPKYEGVLRRSLKNQLKRLVKVLFRLADKAVAAS